MKFSKLNVLAIVLFVGPVVACASFGSDPSDAEKKKFSRSSQYNSETGEFENRRPGLIDAMRDKAMTWSNMVDFILSGEDGVPSEKLPEVKPDLTAFLKPSEDLKIIWFGHSTFLLNMDGTVILVDPVFSDAAAPVSFFVPRFQPPVLSLDELPHIDYVLISHDHYDHLDMESIQHFLASATQFITPLGVGSHLKSWGIKPERIIEKDWWESVKFDSVEFVATPAQHFSGRSSVDGNATLWASWVIRSKDHRVYFSGDSGYDTHFQKIGDAYGPFDVAFLDCGQYNKLWLEVHLTPEKAVQAFMELNGRRLFPIHWGMFELAKHPWYEPIERLMAARERQDFNLLAPRIGQIVTVGDEEDLDLWWKIPKREIHALIQ